MAVVPRRLGLTGGIGSGKSTVSRMLARMGASLIDADAISRATTEPGGPAVAALQAAFGTSVLTQSGALDREHMRSLVFSDPIAKARLEAIVHPLVRQAIAQQADEATMAGTPCIVFDIPLLVESGHWRTFLDRILVIDCTEKTQITRVVARNDLSESEVRRILAAQAPRTQRLSAADLVLFNDGICLDDLQQQVTEMGVQFGL